MVLSVPSPAAVNDGQAAIDHLLAKLADTVTLEHPGEDIPRQARLTSPGTSAERQAP
jgi:hypothetical protein